MSRRYMIASVSFIVLVLIGGTYAAISLDKDKKEMPNTITIEQNSLEQGILGLPDEIVKAIPEDIAGNNNAGLSDIPQLEITPNAVITPETTAPEATVPKATVPEVTAPKVTAPKAAAPKATAPAPQVTAPKVDIIQGTNKNPTINTAPPKSTTTKPNPNTAGSGNYANEVIRLVNVERTKAGCSTLTTNSTLTSAANKRADETVQSFAHTRPNGSQFSTVLQEYGVSYRTAGENIAYGQKTPQEVVTGWMNSQGHRANILNANFGKIGVGVYENNGVYHWVQLFTD